jgi:hypothetical protein
MFGYIGVVVHGVKIHSSNHVAHSIWNLREVFMFDMLMLILYIFVIKVLVLGSNFAFKSLQSKMCSYCRLKLLSIDV